jgi:hypothetical protein
MNDSLCLAAPSIQMHGMNGVDAITGITNVVSMFLAFWMINSFVMVGFFAYMMYTYLNRMVGLVGFVIDKCTTNEEAKPTISSMLTFCDISSAIRSAQQKRVAAEMAAAAKDNAAAEDNTTAAKDNAAAEDNAAKDNAAADPSAAGSSTASEVDTSSAATTPKDL